MDNFDRDYSTIRSTILKDSRERLLEKIEDCWRNPNLKTNSKQIDDWEKVDKNDTREILNHLHYYWWSYAEVWQSKYWDMLKKDWKAINEDEKTKDRKKNTDINFANGIFKLTSAFLNREAHNHLDKKFADFAQDCLNLIVYSNLIDFEFKDILEQTLIQHMKTNFRVTPDGRLTHDESGESFFVHSDKGARLVAIEKIRTDAEKGISDAECAYGILRLLGIGVEKDHSLAF